MTTTIKAADLPQGSVVANEEKTWIKDFRDRDYCWTDQHGHVYNDFMVQGYIDMRGATVLMEGL